MLTGISLFSGAGGLDLAAKWAGIKTVAYVEYDPYAQGVLMSRMRDGSLDAAPIFEDVRTFRGTSLRGSIDVVSGGFPCQDVSVAGKQEGIREGTRSGLWKEFARIIREVGPRFVLVENVPGLLLYGQLGIVLGDLAEMGFDAQWSVLSAADVGANHLRERVWIVANARQELRYQRRDNKEGEASEWSKSPSKPERRRKNVPDTAGARREPHGNWKPGRQESVCDATSERFQDRTNKPLGRSEQKQEPKRSNWWATEPNVGRVANGVAFRVDRLRCCGNGVVPQQALPAFQKIVEMSKAPREGREK